jgi:hypothetical protein
MIGKGHRKGKMFMKGQIPLGKPSNCSQCGILGHGRRMHWANKSRNYQRIKSDWIRLCPKCHGVYDKGNRRSVARSL